MFEFTNDLYPLYYCLLVKPCQDAGSCVIKWHCWVVFVLPSSPVVPVFWTLMSCRNSNVVTLIEVGLIFMQFPLSYCISEIVKVPWNIKFCSQVQSLQRMKVPRNESCKEWNFHGPSVTFAPSSDYELAQVVHCWEFVWCILYVMAILKYRWISIDINCMSTLTVLTVLVSLAVRSSNEN